MNVLFAGLRPLFRPHTPMDAQRPMDLVAARLAELH